jgi:hypothetical protein
VQDRGGCRGIGGRAAWAGMGQLVWANPKEQ